MDKKKKSFTHTTMSLYDFLPSRKDKREPSEFVWPMMSDVVVLVWVFVCVWLWLTDSNLRHGGLDERESDRIDSWSKANRLSHMRETCEWAPRAHKKTHTHRVARVWSLRLCELCHFAECQDYLMTHLWKRMIDFCSFLSREFCFVLDGNRYVLLC